MGVPSIDQKSMFLAELFLGILDLPAAAVVAGLPVLQLRATQHDNMDKA
jgi:hypothetical protein